MLWESLAGSVLALGLFVLAAVTDWIDGWLARRLKLVSPFGIFWDPLADKVLVLAALCAFLWLNVVSVWMVVIILAREFLITSVRIFAQQARGMNLPAMPEGKQKMLSQAVAIIGTLAILVARHAVTAATGQPYDTALRRMGDGGAFLARLMDDLPDVLLLVATALSVYSGARFLWRHRRLLSRT
jgi:CDP-diacylglycerol--glycerol-3-phosphate 3-phosphatidyltransferase